MKRTRGGPTLDRVFRQQTALAHFGAFVFREEDIHKILTEAARVCAQGTNVQYCKVVRYRPETNDLQVEAGVGWHDGVVGHAIAKADAATPVGRAFVTGEPVITKDLRTATDLEQLPIYRDHAIVSTVNVPIAGIKGPYGVLEIDSPQRREFDQHDIDFLAGFANVLAGAVAMVERIEALRAALAERDVLTQELQHRVRNNLQLVHHLLDRQARETRDAEAKRGFENVARRVMALAEVYQHLLGVGMSRRIDLGEYMRSLCLKVLDLNHAQSPDVDLKLEIEPLRVDLSMATALGIIVNELVANSFEHAFPGRKGTVRVMLRASQEPERIELIVADDGVGFGAPSSSTRLGLHLVKRLAEQVRGTAVLDSERGTMWTITAPIERHPG